MPYAHAEKQRAYLARWHQEHRAPVRSRTRARRVKLRKDMRAAIAEAKSVPCADCDQRYPSYVMDFDHVRGEKVVNLADAVRTLNTMAALLAEMAKCDVVCANCHRIRTHERREMRIEDMPL